MNNKCLLCGKETSIATMNVVMDNGNKLHLSCVTKGLKGKELSDENIIELVGNTSKQEIREAMCELKEAIGDVAPLLDNLDDKLSNLKDIIQKHKAESENYREALDMLEKEYLSITVTASLEDLNQSMLAHLDL